MIFGREDIRKWRENICREFWGKEKKTLWEKYILKIPVSKESVCDKIYREILLSVQAKELSPCRI